MAGEWKETKGLKIIKWIFAILVVMVAVYLLTGLFLLPKDVTDSGYFCKEFVSKWSRVYPDGTRSEFSVPGTCDAERNELITIETTLPDDIGYDEYLCFRGSRQDLSMYVDGELRQEYSTKNTRLFGRSSATAYVFLKLTKEDAGKTLTVTNQSDSSYTGIFFSVYRGDRMGIWKKLADQYASELVVAFLTLILGLISIAGSVALRLCYKRQIELEFLGWGVVLAAMWIITNSVFRQLLFPNLSTVADLTFIYIILIPIPILIYMSRVQRGRYDRCYEVAGFICILTCVICVLLHVTSIVDFTDTIVAIAVVCVSSILLMATTMILDMKKGYIRQYPLVAAGVLCAFAASIVQFIMYFQRTSTFNGVTLAIGLIFLLVFSVINTIRQIMYMEREKQKALLSNKSKARFLANMSHEIRTPINAILGMDAMILRETKDNSIKEYALDIQNASQSLLALINDILDFSKIESGKMELQPAEYDFSSMIHDIMNMITMKAEKKGLDMDLSIDENLPSRLWGDDVRIRQILVNILNNAVKYTNEGGVTLRVKGEVEDNNVCLYFEVEDTGIGIKEENLAKIFAEYERVEDKKIRYIEGTGLGMSITTHLLSMMGSTLQVKSVYGEGSRFFFYLNQEIMDKEPIGNLEKRIQEQATEFSYEVSFRAPQAKILVVDDNSINRRVFMNLVKQTEVSVDEASGGLPCLDMVAVNQYDIIFLDHMMPDLDGIATLHKMRSWEDYPCKETPVVALTANAISGAREMYLEEGFDNFLSKPVNPDKLENMLQELLPKDKIIYEKEISVSGNQDSNIEFPEIEGIDFEYAMLRMKNATILQNTILDFYRMIDSEAKELESFWQGLLAGDEEAWKFYRVKVHAMKSSAAMIGATGISGVAKMLEYAARDKKLDIVKSVTPTFLEEWRHYKELLKEVLPEEEEKVAPDYPKIREYLGQLDNALQEMDLGQMDEIMEQILVYQYPDSLQGMISDLQVSITNIDVESASKIIATIQNEIEQEG